MAVAKDCGFLRLWGTAAPRLPGRQALSCRAVSPGTDTGCYWLGVSLRAVSFPGEVGIQDVKDRKLSTSKLRL